MRLTTLITTVVFVFCARVASLNAEATLEPGNSAATITASFADSCRDFHSHASKDISHVEIHYADGRIVKDEKISGDDYAIDGGFGDEIDFAIVKSGTTRQQFDCVPSNSAPTARLEIRTPEDCYEFWQGGLRCEQSTARTSWTSADDVPDTGGSDAGLFHWGCGSMSDRSHCSFVFTFRGTSSSDPDGDVTRWSLDFGDGASASGSWNTAPPAEVTHDYAPDACGNICVVTLTVTDAVGQSHSTTMRMVFVDETPD